MKLTFRYKGGPGSGFHGHLGRPGKVGGSISGKGTSEARQLFIKSFADLHNKASAEYKAAFKKVGARMWNADSAHMLKKPNIESMIGMADAYKDPARTLRKIHTIVRPITVLDSYPNVTDEQREWLDKEVDTIYAKYSALLEELRNELL